MRFALQFNQHAIRLNPIASSVKPNAGSDRRFASAGKLAMIPPPRLRLAGCSRCSSCVSADAEPLRKQPGRSPKIIPMAMAARWLSIFDRSTTREIIRRPPPPRGNQRLLTKETRAGKNPCP
jgi:hypothetical protein